MCATLFYTFAHMEEKNGKTQYEDLKAAIEKVAMRKIVVKRDFEYLSMHIQNRTGVYISLNTLRRLWENDKYDITPRLYTLDSLANYVGYNSYAAFEKSMANGETKRSSGFLVNDYLVSNTLQKGQQVQITWEPGRLIIVEYIGCEMFKVIESINSKLSKDDTFQTDIITQGEPLYLNRLIHEGNEPTRYFCGKVSGVRYRIITNDEDNRQ